MSKKYYAVKSGRSVGIYNTWDECKKQVMGYSGAVYKSFPDLAEAKKYLDNSSAKHSELFPNETAIAYVDGSYNIKTKDFSCGVVIFYNGDVYELSKKFTDATLCEMRNVAGEIKGAEMAIKFCLDKGIKHVNIFHDYEGVARWCDGSWKANKQGTKDYTSFCQSAKNNLFITFTKVKGHSGDKYNDLADRLAKDALGIGVDKKRIL